MTERCGLRRARKGDITDWLLSPWMPLGKQWPHSPKWSLICRPEWHLFFPQQGSTFSYFTSRGDICHRKWIRGLVFLRWHSSIGGLRLHTWEVKTNCVLLGHLAVGGRGMVLAWPVALLAPKPLAPSSHSSSISIQKNWVAQLWDHVIAYFAALGSKKENGKKKKKIQLTKPNFFLALISLDWDFLLG